MRATSVPSTATKPIAVAASLSAAGIALAITAFNVVSGGIVTRVPALTVPVAAFIGSQALVRRVRPSWQHPICARNWLLFLFGIQLVVVPILIMTTSPFLGVLPHLPTDSGIAAASLLQSLAYVSCIGGLALMSARNAKLHRVGRAVANSQLSSVRQLRASPSPVLIVAALGVGLLGGYLRFGSLSTVLDYFSGTSSIAYQIATATTQVPIAQSVSTVLLPFLGVGFVCLACRGMDQHALRTPGKLTGIPMAAVIVAGLVLSNALYAYNRGAVVMPLLALAATYSSRSRRLPTPAVAALGIAFLGTFLAVGAFRNSYFLEQAGAGASATASTGASEQIQVYGQGPQFLGYLLDYTPASAVPMGGGPLIASALSPLPVVGRDFRARSGTSIYNELIYGGRIASDQILPLEGELYWNFSIYGVVGGFCALGMAVAVIDRRSLRTSTSIRAYVWQFTGFWTAFLVIASVGVFAQVVVYSIAPFGLVVLADKLLSSRSSAGSMARSAHNVQSSLGETALLGSGLSKSQD